MSPFAASGGRPTRRPSWLGLRAVGSDAAEVQHLLEQGPDRTSERGRECHDGRWDIVDVGSPESSRLDDAEQTEAEHSLDRLEWLLPLSMTAIRTYIAPSARRMARTS
jgi:hypothetical protein